jgi:glycosyltransferase involved in cell wall biosynthesis
MAPKLSSVPGIRPPFAEARSGTQILSVVCVIGGEDFTLALTELHREISSLDVPTELVVVLNGGGAAVNVLRDAAERYDRLQVYVMKQRVDHVTAVMAGIENAIGDWIATIDLEADPPVIIRRLFESVVREHAEVALSIPDRARGTLIDVAISRLFHRVFRTLHGFSLATEAPSARLLSRAVVNSLLRHDSPLVAFETLTARNGYRRCVISGVQRASARLPRAERVRIRWRTLIGINALPLRIVNLLCGISAVCALSYSSYVVFIYLLKDNVVPGWTTVSLLLSAMFLALSLVLWLLSEYMLMLLDPGARRPQYEIADEFGGQLRSPDNMLNVETEL